MSKANQAFQHTPVRPAREGCLGEQVFLKNWQELLAQDNGYHPDFDGPNGMLMHVVSPGDGILTQRHATVAASLVRWLGTNNGLGFLQQADLMCDSLGDREEGYIAEWALENRRSRTTNSGIRVLEAVMMEQRAVKPPKLSADDCETMEQVLMWLASEHTVYVVSGQSFLQKCRNDIQVGLREERSRVRAARESTILLSEPACSLELR